VVEGIAECGGISGETVVEGSSLSVEGGGEGLSGVLEGGVLGNLHVTNEDLDVGEGLLNTSLESLLLGGDQLVDLGLGVVVGVVKFALELLNAVDNLFTEIVNIT
jgi:hypothetical protein